MAAGFGGCRANYVLNRKERFTLRRRGNYGGTGVLNRGDRRKAIFLADDDRERFLATLGEACGKTWPPLVSPPAC
jgi:hypothetical protein